MQELKHHVWLPVVPTEKMLLDLALTTEWLDYPGETREDFEASYKRMLTFLPELRPGVVLAPVEPEERMLLGLAGVDKFLPDSEDGECSDFLFAYEGYELMLAELKAEGQSDLQH